MLLTYPTAAALLLIALGMLLAFSTLSVMTPMSGFKDETIRGGAVDELQTNREALEMGRQELCDDTVAALTAARRAPTGPPRP